MSGTRVSRLCFVALAAACTTTGTNKERIEPTFINVSLAGDLATPEAPLPFTVEPQAWTATVSTLDAEGDPYPFNGDLKVRIRPGRLDMDSWVTLTDGAWTGEVLMHAGFGPTRIWFGDEGDKSADSTREASWATGVSEPISYDLATIAEMQKCDDVDTNNLVGEFSELRVADRQVVVTALGTSGFWVTDLADPTGSYNSLFVYTFNEPRDVALGDQLIQLGGGNNEYLGATQLSWPTYQTAEGVSLTVPDPVPLTSTIACGRSPSPTAPAPSTSPARRRRPTSPRRRTSARRSACAAWCRRSGARGSCSSAAKKTSRSPPPCPRLRGLRPPSSRPLARAPIRIRRGRTCTFCSCWPRSRTPATSWTSGSRRRSRTRT